MSLCSVPSLVDIQCHWMLLERRASLNSVAVRKRADSICRPIHTRYTEYSKHFFTCSNIVRQQMSWYLHWMSRAEPTREELGHCHSTPYKSNWVRWKEVQLLVVSAVTSDHTIRGQRGTGPEERKVKRDKVRYWWCHDLSDAGNRSGCSLILKNGVNKNLYIRCFKTQHNQHLFRQLQYGCSINFVEESFTNIHTHTDVKNCIGYTDFPALLSLQSARLLLLHRGQCDVLGLRVVTMVVKRAIMDMAVTGKEWGKWGVWWRGGKGKPSRNVLGSTVTRVGFTAQVNILRKLGRMG
jgi:hypothetical protein